MKPLIALLLLLVPVGISAQTTFDTGTARRLAPVTFNGLGTPRANEIRRCSDCTVADPTTGGGTGAVVVADGVKWYALGTQSGGGVGGLLDPGSPGILKRTSLNVTEIATPGVDYLHPLGNGSGLAGLTFTQLSGSVSDAQIPNNITIDQATVALTANAGDSATAFFSAGAIEPARGGTGLGAPGDDQVIVGNGTGFDFKTLPSCSNATTDKLLYDQSTNTFTCGTDQTSGGGSGITSLNTLTAATQTIDVVNDTNFTGAFSQSSATNHRLTLGFTGTLADSRVADDITLTNITQITNRAIGNTTGDLAASRVDDGGVAATQALFSGAGAAAGFRAIAEADLPAAIARDSEINVQGTANEITSSGSGVAPTLSLSSTIDLGGKTSLEVPNGTAPTTDVFGELAGDSNAWAASRGALQFYDGTANTYVVATLASDTPTDGQYPRWNTGGTITWETVAGSGDMVLAASQVVTGRKEFDPAKLVIGDVSASPTAELGALYVDTDDGGFYFGLNGTTWGEIYIGGKSLIDLSLHGSDPTVDRVTGILPQAGGGLGVALSDPNADRILFWDDSAGAYAYLTLGTNLSITGTTLDATGGGSGTINSGVTNTIPKYTASTTLDDSLLSDNGTSLTYGGSGTGIWGLKDTDASHYLNITPGSNLTADRTLTLTTGDAARSLSMGGNITTAADLITSGANSLTLTTTGSTNVTLPTTGTLATLGGSETFTGTKDYSGSVFELPNGTSLVSGDCDAAGEAGRIFIDTDATTGQRVYVCEGAGGWVLQGDGGGAGGAPTDATYITQTANGTLSAEQALGALATGILKSTTTTGVVSIAGVHDIETPLFCSDSGSSDAYACSLSPVITGYLTGSHYRFKANTANTGAATIALNGLSAVTIVKVAGGITTALVDNDIRAGQWVDLVYDGTNMQMQSTLGNASAGGGANTALSNLASVAINTTLVSDTDNTDDLGTSAIRWKNLYLGGFIGDGNGNELLKFTQTAAAVNEFTVINASTGTGPELQSTGSDTNINMYLVPKGTGALLISPTTAGTGVWGLIDTNQSHYLNITPGSNLTADRTLTLTTGDADRTLTMGGAITTAADFITSGANSLTLTTTGSTNVTLPTSGTLATTSQLAGAASETVAGVIEIATTAEINTGTDATRAVAPDQFAASNFGTRVVQVVAFDFTVDTATGDGKFYFVVPEEVNGMNLVGVRAQVVNSGTTNATNVDLARCATAATGNACSGTVVDMLSTNITIDSGENSTDTAATPAVIDTANDDVATGQVIRVDVDAVSTTPAKGLIVTMKFRLP